MDLSKLSVVVPTRRESANISRLAASLPSSIPLILVDTGEDDTIEVARRHHALTIAANSDTHVAESRNIGARLARSPWLLFTDADVSFPTGYFPRLSLITPPDCLYGAIMAQDAHAGLYKKFAAWQSRFDQLGIPAVNGSNLLVRRTAFLDAGGFDTRLLVNEDTELGYRMKRLGYSVRFSHRLTMIAHDHRRLRRGAFQKNLRTLLRCALIYCNLFPRPWRGREEAYWSPQEDIS